MTKTGLIDRRTAIASLVVALVTPLGAETQQAGRAWRIGFVEAGSSSTNRHLLGAFRQGLDRAFGAMSKQRVGGLIVYPDALTVRHRARIVDLAAKSQLPAMYAYPEFVHAGGLMAYSASLPDLFRRSATYVDKILKGAKPGDLPVEQPTKFDLVINLKTAKALGLIIPQSLLLRADQLID